jgi:signal peptidase I
MDKYSKISNSYLQPVLDIWSEKQEQTVCPISGNCMAPLIREGDILVIEHGNQMIKTGDVAVYREQGVLYVHRVIRIHRRNGNIYYFFKPDQNFNINQNISADNIIGKVIETRGANGRVNFNSLFWKCANPALATIFYSVWRSRNRSTPYWKLINRLLLTWQRFKPASFTTSNSLLRLICKTNTLWSRVRSFNTNKE